MNSLHRRQFLGLSLGLAGSPSILTAAAPAAGNGTAPARPNEELLKFKKVEITQQPAPDYTLKGATKEKRFKAKDWLELDMEWDVKAPRAASREKILFLDDVTINYYIFLAPADEKKKKVLTASVTYINIPVEETIHSVVYLSPSTLFNITGDKLANKGLITYYGAEAKMGETLVGRAASQLMGGLPWWQSPNLPPSEGGRLLPKNKTPFAPLWYDYYMEEKAER